MKQYLAIDIGGTAVKLGIVDETGKVLCKGEQSVNFDGYQTPVLDTVRKAGLCVTDTNLMTPRKSVTALLGVSDHPVKGQLAGCGHCVLRTRCEYRKRGKTCASE